jgi:hypothetical protein
MDPANVIIHPHAMQRLSERGATESEVEMTVRTGEHFIAKHGRSGFRLNFIFNGQRNGKYFTAKQIEAYAILENETWIVITIIVKFF